MTPLQVLDAYHAQKNAFATSQKYYPTGPNGEPGLPGNYDRNDAFRHAYWSALLARRLGSTWSAEFTSAHEGYFGNPGPAEAMDLYNNEVGRNLALFNPEASDAELAALIHDATESGALVIIADNGQLQWSDFTGNHAQPSDFHEVTGEDSLPGQRRDAFGLNDSVTNFWEQQEKW